MGGIGEADTLDAERVADTDTLDAATAGERPLTEEPDPAPNPHDEGTTLDVGAKAPPSDGSRDDTTPLGSASETSAATYTSGGASAPPAWRGRLGRETPGRYETQGLLGEGAFGRVVEVFDTYLDRVVALKQLRIDPDGQPRSMRGVELRFEHEARITGKLEHPGILPVYELGRRTGDGSLYYVMRKVDGHTLLAALGETEGLADRLHYLPHFLAACNAMAYAHARGVIHRDLKPDNIMVGPFGQTLVVDWGLAKVQGEDDLQGPLLSEEIRGLREGEKAETLAGAALGTPSYMPPEQCLGLLEEVDARSDVYALGAVLYRIIAGRPPVEGDSVGEIVLRTVDGTVEPPTEHAHDCPPELAAVAMRALSHLPDDRYDDAGALADDIEAFLDGGLVGAHRYSRAQLLGRWVRRHWPLVLGLVAAAALVITVVQLRRRELRSLEAERLALQADAEATRRQKIMEQVEAILADAEGGATEPRWLQTYAFRIANLDEPVAREALIGRLERALSHPIPEVRQLAARALSGVEADASRQALTARLALEPEERVRVEIIQALGVYGDHRAQEAVADARWKAGQFSRLWDQTRLAYRMIPMPPLADGGASLSADDWTDRGRALSNKGDPDGAIAAYSRALTIDPAFGRALNNRAIEYNRKERYEEALRDYDAALAADPAEPKARFNRASVKRRMEDYAGAIADYTRLIEQHELETNALRNRAFAFRWLGDYERAITDYLTVIDLQPQNPRAYYSLGNTYLDMDRWDDARTAFDGALTHNREYVAAMVGRAMASRMQGNLELAMADYDRAVSTDPADDGARIGRAALRVAMGDAEGAREDLDHCLVSDCPRAEDRASLRLAARAILAHGSQGRYRAGLADIEAAYLQARKRSDRAEAAIWGAVLAHRAGGRGERLEVWRQRLREAEGTEHWHDAVLAVSRGDMTYDALSARTPLRYRRCLLLIASGVAAESGGQRSVAHTAYERAEAIHQPAELSCILAALSAQALAEGVAPP